MSTYDGMIRIWDLATGQPIGPSLEIPRQGDNRPLTNTYALALEFGPDGRTVLGCLWNPQFTVRWDGTSGELINSFPSVVLRKKRRNVKAIMLMGGDLRG